MFILGHRNTHDMFYVIFVMGQGEKVYGMSYVNVQSVSRINEVWWLFLVWYLPLFETSIIFGGSVLKIGLSLNRTTIKKFRNSQR